MCRTEDPLSWWRAHEAEFPDLAKAAKVLLAIPASSAPVERVFSRMTSVSSAKRGSLSAELLAVLGFLASN